MAAKTIGSTIAIIIAEVSPTVNSVMQLHVPPIIMEIFQCIAWASGGVLAILGVIKYLKRSK